MGCKSTLRVGVIVMVLPTLARRMAVSTRPPCRMVLSRGYKTENPLYKDDVRKYATNTTAIDLSFRSPSPKPVTLSTTLERGRKRTASATTA